MAGWKARSTRRKTMVPREEEEDIKTFNVAARQPKLPLFRTVAYSVKEGRGSSHTIVTMALSFLTLPPAKIPLMECIKTNKN